METLPLHVLLTIFAFLDSESLSQVSRVSKRLRAISKLPCTSTVITFYGTAAVQFKKFVGQFGNDLTRSLIISIPLLNETSRSRRPVIVLTVENARIVRDRCPNLQSVKLLGPLDIPHDSFTILSELNLTYIDLSWTNVKDSSVRVVLNFKTLRVLYLHGCKMLCSDCLENVDIAHIQYIHALATSISVKRLRPEFQLKVDADEEDDTDEDAWLSAKRTCTCRRPGRPYNRIPHKRPHRF